ncbi:MAG TPA: hypothetical protein DEQ61_13075, partial [Streptomyces sp.]|nr:hypothetical protein [Streptomyces sp.]
QGGFDFFGAQSARAAQQRPELTAAASEDDLADVVGAEAFAEHEAREAGGTRKAALEAERQPGKRQPKKARQQKPQEQDGLREPSELQDVPELHGFQGDDQRQPEHRSQKHAASEVIDLTEHDQTEQLDMRELRAHTS